MNLTSVATIAKSLAPRDKNSKEAYKAVLQAIEHGGKLTESETATLYAYFMPKPPKKPKTPEHWVALAMGKNDVRYYLNYVYSDGKRIMATDGHRLHVIDKAIEPGFYDSNMVRVECDAKYPDIDRVMPKNNGKLIKLADCKRITDTQNGTPKDFYEFSGIRIDADYMDAACALFDDPVIKYTDKESAVRIDQGDKTAVVMPIRIW